VTKSRFLVIGGAGSIGEAVVREIFIPDPKALHVDDNEDLPTPEIIKLMG
jgi:FlaA1/EpsC-like NDP-sugar epimerase